MGTIGRWPPIHPRRSHDAPNPVLAMWFVTLAGVDASGQDSPPEPSGYRMEHYRGPTPATLAGARVIITAEAEELWKAGAIFVDVHPHAVRPANLPPGTIWREQTRKNIPGSIWLPDAGYGALAPETEGHLRSNLDRAASGDYAKWLVVYCRPDCWMSWNAAKRVLAMGYRNVVWYPQGTDGWEASGLPLQEAKPAPADGE
jgi:PQQ-dependent catabolism-associated CXXCW motif protein